MMDEGKVRFALALPEGRLHKAVGGKRCGCGACGHWVAVAACHAGLAREELEAVSPAPAKPTRRRGRAGVQGAFTSATPAAIRVRGRDVDAREGLAIPCRACITPRDTARGVSGSPLSGDDRGHPVLGGHRSYSWSHHRRRATTAAWRRAVGHRLPFVVSAEHPATARTARYRAVTQCAGVRAVAHIATALACGSR